MAAGHCYADYGHRAELLGRGGTAEVYRLGVKYAVKLLPYRKGTVSLTALNEIVYPRKLEHPGVVSYHDVFFRPDYIELIMPLYDGDLSELGPLEGQGDGARDIFDSISGQLQAALTYLKGQEILHLDVKPQNIFYKKLAGGYSCVLADFGLATRWGSEGPAGQFCWNVYSPVYRAPEVWLKSYEGYGYAAEIWALGCTLFELWTGEILMPSGFPGARVALLPAPSRGCVLYKGYKAALSAKIGYSTNRFWYEAALARCKGGREDEGFPPSLISSSLPPLVKDPEICQLLISMLEIDPGKRMELRAAEICPDNFQPPPAPASYPPLPPLANISQVIIWLLEIKRAYRLSIEAYMLSIDLCYKFIRLSEEVGKLEMTAAVAAVYLAAIFRDYAPWISVGNLCKTLPSDGPPKSFVNAMIIKWLPQIDWDIGCPSTLERAINRAPPHTSSRILASILIVFSPISELYTSQHIIERCIQFASKKKSRRVKTSLRQLTSRVREVWSSQPLPAKGLLSLEAYYIISQVVHAEIASLHLINL